MMEKIQPSRKAAVYALLGTLAVTVVYTIGIPYAATMAWLSLMFFDSGPKVSTVFAVASIFAMPASLLVSLAGMWVALFTRRYRWCAVWALLPMGVLGCSVVLFIVASSLH